jgi:hypothetical protein
MLEVVGLPLQPASIELIVNKMMNGNKNLLRENNLLASIFMYHPFSYHLHKTELKHFW